MREPRGGAAPLIVEMRTGDDENRKTRRLFEPLSNGWDAAGLPYRTDVKKWTVPNLISQH